MDNLPLETQAGTSRRATNSRLEMYIEMPTNNPYMRSEMWRKRSLVLNSILCFIAVGYTIMIVTLASMYSSIHQLIWILNLVCASLVLITSGTGVACCVPKVSRIAQFRLSIAFAVGLFIFLSIQLFLGLATPRSDCLMPGNKGSTKVTDEPTILDVCTMTVEAIVVYTTIGVSALYFSALWFSTFVRLRIMKQEDAIVAGVPPPVPTPTGTLPEIAIQ
jgi:uncharacterized protein (DUF983 family)